MLRPGSIDGDGEWNEATSLARSIEAEMVAEELIDLDDETPDAARQRRRTLIATARGIIEYFKANMDITVDVGALRDSGESGAALPAAAKSYTVSSGKITIPAGDIRAASATGVRLPLTTKTLSGKVS
ncbi:MAG TPA: hypothetical protein VF188_01500 [Longimicrobiales bacterium]